MGVITRIELFPGQIPHDGDLVKLHDDRDIVTWYRITETRERRPSEDESESGGTRRYWDLEIVPVDRPDDALDHSPPE